MCMEVLTQVHIRQIKLYSLHLLYCSKFRTRMSTEYMYLYFVHLQNTYIADLTWPAPEFASGWFQLLGAY